MNSLIILYLHKNLVLEWLIMQWLCHTFLRSLCFKMLRERRGRFHSRWWHGVGKSPFSLILFRVYYLIIKRLHNSVDKLTYNRLWAQSYFLVKLVYPFMSGVLETLIVYFKVNECHFLPRIDDSFRCDMTSCITHGVSLLKSLDPLNIKSKMVWVLFVFTFFDSTSESKFDSSSKSDGTE